MLKLYLSLALLLLATCHLSAQVTLEECVKLAQDNYPLIRKYDLLNQTKAVNLSDINKSWLPQINVYGQGTVQNEIPSFPESLAGTRYYLPQDAGEETKQKERLEEVMRWRAEQRKRRPD